jgi:glycosyltransferase involved in cell wall biosynthesis
MVSTPLAAATHRKFGFPPISGKIALTRIFTMETRGILLQKSGPPQSEVSIPGAGTVPDSALEGQEFAPARFARMISIIIPAHNEERYLDRTLQALQRQNYGWFEVIVVANGCTDRTKEVARGRCHRLIVLSQKSLGVARNLGARMARGELLLFLDADTLLEPMALRIIAETFTVRYAAGTIQGRPDDNRLAYRLIYGLKNLIHRCSLHPGSSGVILCWKEHFFRVGGFDEGLEVRENSELAKRLLRFGRYKYIGQVSATTSMRRYHRCGVGRVVWLWCKLWFESWLCDLHQKRYQPVR